MNKSNVKVDLRNSPVRLARLKIFPTLSIEQVAEKIGINWQSLYLSECAVYDSIPPKITLFFKQHEIDTVQLNFEYKTFQTNQRRKFAEQFGIKIDQLPEGSLQEYYTSLGLSRTAFAKLICVQPATLYKLETGQLKSLSAQLWSALATIGMSADNICELNERVEEDYYNVG